MPLHIHLHQGFLICPSFLDVSLLDDSLKAVEGLVDYVARQLYNTGRIKGRLGEGGGGLE